MAQTAQAGQMTPVAQAAQAAFNAVNRAAGAATPTASANAQEALRAAGSTKTSNALDSTGVPNTPNTPSTSNATAALATATPFAALFTAPSAAPAFDRPPGLVTPPPTAVVTLPARWESAEFLPALGRQVAFFARDGIEHARVHLNPLDMGPIQVQLALDGTQVRLDLSVEIAATRQLLEQSLPQLASALREGGFTLAGGGVFQDPRQAADGRGEAANAGFAGPGADGRGEGRGQPGSSGASGGPGPGGPAIAVPVRARRAEGLVDLYA